MKTWVSECFEYMSICLILNQKKLNKIKQWVLNRTLKMNLEEEGAGSAVASKAVYRFQAKLKLVIGVNLRFDFNQLSGANKKRGVFKGQGETKNGQNLEREGLYT